MINITFYFQIGNNIGNTIGSVVKRTYNGSTFDSCLEQLRIEHSNFSRIRILYFEIGY